MDNFRQKTKIRVRTFEIDSQNRVHNSLYLQYLEIGRIEYLRSLGYDISLPFFFDKILKIVTVHNSIDYKSFAMLDDELIIHSKISWIKNSSFCFEQFITKEKNNELVCEAKGILVNLNIETNQPEKISEELIKKIIEIDYPEIIKK